MINIKREDINNLVEAARSSPRKRMNLNIHQSLDATVQRFFNAMEPDTYVRPHRHVQDGRFELFLCIRGKGAAITFDDSGKVLDSVIISPDGVSIGIEIPPRAWHTILCLSPGTVFFELKEGPYMEIDDKDFAAWAPDPSNPGSYDYLRRLKEGIGC
ncbi:MAG: WbuC family cupin fold metalloprotein [Deltaproteobacteria bacterium]|nr:WbuC family cupin fold metalloprotein [Deltaproteobacteria bacterium]